jgi:aminopeptidase S
MACALGLAVALAGCGTAVPGSADNSTQGGTAPAVSRAGATQHLQALQRIADENGGNRASPSPGYEASVDYVATVLRGAGYQVSTPTFPISTGRGGGVVTLRSVVAQTRTGAADHIVMAGAHLDSVAEGPGINDNGSGVATLLEVATQLSGSPQVRNTVRFAFWGSEEDDLQGSTHYVQTLSDADRRGIMLYLNLDMLASKNAGYFVQGEQGDTGDEKTENRGTSREVGRPSRRGVRLLLPHRL